MPNRLRLVSIVVVVLIASAACSSPQPAAEEEPYNVLFIAIDDLRPELNCYGASHIHSPNIDRLAASGVRFTNAHVQQAICMASRASMLSGIRPERYGMYTGEPVSRVLPDVLTLNRFFDRNGYTVASSGKIYHYAEDTKAQFGEAYLAPGEAWNGTKYALASSIAQGKTNSKGRNGPATECADLDDEAYLDGINTAHAVERLAELQGSDAPFFLAVGLVKPHLPFTAPKKYFDLYPEEEIGLASLREHPANTSSISLRTKGELTNYSDMPDTFAEISDSTARALRRAYFASVSYADAQVGKLLDALDEYGFRQNTIVVLWGDHGYKLGDYGEWCKWSNMDVDTRVPLIVRVPGQSEGTVAEAPVETLDLYPTLADLCGLPAPEHLDGRSLGPLLANPRAASDTARYVHTLWPQNRWTFDKTVMGYAVKDARYNYVEWVQLATGEVLERELYDHDTDPQESVNVVGEQKHAAEVQRLAALVQVRKRETDKAHGFRKLR